MMIGRLSEMAVRPARVAAGIRMNSQRLILVVTLTVRREAVAAFDHFERQAAGIMARYGGQVEREIRLADDGLMDTFRDIHIVSFPDEASFEAYRQDAELASLRPLREQAVVSTELVMGGDVAR